MAQVLTFDVGKTRCRAALMSPGVRGPVATGAGSGPLSDPQGVDGAVSAIRSAAAGLDWTAPDMMAGAVAGFGSAGDRAGALADRLRDAFGLPLVLMSDITAWHAGALAGRPGVVVVAGTGAIALAVRADGRTRQADGWGYLLGDEGGGFWIGREGLAAALRAHDGRPGGSETLRRRALARYGPLEDLPAVIHHGEQPVGAIASFSRDVAAAAGEGDDVAATVWRRAAWALAETAVAAASRAGLHRPDVALTGGLVAAGDLLFDPFTKRLAELRNGAYLIPAEGDALDGAFRVATEEAELHVVRTRRWPAPAGARRRARTSGKTSTS